VAGLQVAVLTSSSTVMATVYLSASTMQKLPSSRDCRRQSGTNRIGRPAHRRR